MRKVLSNVLEWCWISSPALGFLFVICCMLTFGFGLPTQGQDLSKDMRDIQPQIVLSTQQWQDFTNRAVALESNIAAQTANIKSLNDTITALSAKNNELGTALDDVTTQLVWMVETANTQQSATRKLISELETQLAAARKRIAELENTVFVSPFLFRDDFQSLPVESRTTYVLNIPEPKAQYMRLETAAGRKALRLRTWWQQPRDENGLVRTEMRLHRPTTDSRVFLIDPRMSERWTSIDLLIPQDWRKDGNKVLLFQWHHYPQSDVGKNPPLAVFIWNDNLYVRMFFAAEDNIVKSIDLYKQPAQKGAWMRFVFHLRWDYRQVGNGLIESWINGSPMFAAYKGPTGYAFSPEIYSSIGLYWPGATEVPSNYAADFDHLAFYGRWIVGDEKNKFEDFK